MRGWLRRLADRRARKAANAPYRAYRRAVQAEMDAIKARLWAEAALRDATHGRDERACELLMLAWDYGQGFKPSEMTWQPPASWKKRAAS
jgi:hypothetical protein